MSSPAGRHAWQARGLLYLAACGLLLSACGADSTDTAAVAAPEPPVQRLATVVEDYYERYLEMDPLTATMNGDMRFNDRLPNSLSEQWVADLLALEQESLAKLDGIDPRSLTAADRLTYDQFRYGRQIAIEGFRFPAELLPVNHFYSLPVLFAQMAAGGSIQPFATTKDYDDFLGRIRGFVVWSDQAIANMRTGMQQEVVQPRILIEKLIPQLDSFLAADPAASIFLGSLRSFPEGVPAADQARLTAAYTGALTQQLLPAYRRLRDFLAVEYLPATRTSIAATALPNGVAWYAWLVRQETTTSLTPDEIHQIGLDEVKRIRAEMERVKTRVNFTGEMAAFFAWLRTDPQFRFESPEQLLETYGAFKEQVTAGLPSLFAAFPRSDFEIRAVEPYREQVSAAAAYFPGTPDGQRPGLFYVNTYDLASRPNYMAASIFLHEAIPGHHFQVSLQQEIGALPRFRRFGGEDAYVEGWGLYAESLGYDLGLYADPYPHFGALTAEMWRAVRLVVDTGMHAKGWTREQAIDYMRANTALGDADIVAEIERYIAMPAQALSYKIGEIRIRQLRQRAARTLKARFDIREFHGEILNDGALALDVLDAKLARWEQSAAAR